MYRAADAKQLIAQTWPEEFAERTILVYPFARYTKNIKYVVLQISGDQRLNNLTEPLPLHVIGTGMYPQLKWHVNYQIQLPIVLVDFGVSADSRLAGTLF